MMIAPQLKHLLETLNDAQKRAVSAPVEGNMLVLAGAGSGKTRVLVHRIAWLVQAHNISPYAILAVTFTNKASAEMRERTETLLQQPIQGMWIGTFHSLCHRLLRMHWQEAGLEENFHVIDSEDQLRLIRNIHKALNLDEGKWPPKKTQSFINYCKNEGKRADDIESEANINGPTYYKVYQSYEQHCRKAMLVDFGELLLNTYEMLKKNPVLLQQYQNRFEHILVDEFQDTNQMQYRWLQLLLGNNHIMAVGDDDQSIYSWRGAVVDNIFRFEKDFGNSNTIRLERNYRSTSTILEAANAVIENNTQRMGKQLWTQSNQGDPIVLYGAMNEVDEARFITYQLRDWCKQGNALREAAILYRSNAQSRVLEDALNAAGIPYRVYGGQRFFERSEIKDVLAYMRLVVNRNDDHAFERIINTPTRGIGQITLEAIKENASQDNSSLWQAACSCLQANTLTARALRPLERFIQLIGDLDQKLPLTQHVQHIISRSNLLEHYAKDKTEKGKNRVENIKELPNATAQFENSPSIEAPTMAQFIAQVTLESQHSESGSDTQDDYVQLMTLHSAKGLEFPLIVLSGLEEGLFPHKMSTYKTEQLEEERRLCYVGMTRAMQKLIISYAQTRRLQGSSTYQCPSRFIAEIPSQLLEHLGYAQPPQNAAPPRLQPHTTETQSRSHRHSGFTAITPQKGSEIPHSGLHIGQSVVHPKFGAGIILKHEGRGEFARLQVQFQRSGAKWLILSHAKLEPV